MQGQFRTLTPATFLAFDQLTRGKPTGCCPNCGKTVVNLIKCGYLHCGHIFCGECAIYKPVEQNKIGLDAKSIYCPGCRRELKLPSLI